MRKSQEPDLPIRVEFGQETLDWGMAAVPRVILRFYRHLESDGERLDDREMMPLLLILALWGDGERELRLSNIPSATPLATLEERYLRKWRRMGLVFTRRVYYTYEEMVEHYGGKANVPDTPRLKARVFDLSSLLYNCLRVPRLWQEAYPAAKARWEKDHRKWRETGERDASPHPPHPHFPPSDFRVEIALPLNVALRIVEGKGEEKYQFVPKKWEDRAKALVGSHTPTIRPGRERAPTDCRGTEGRTPTIRPGQLGKPSPCGEGYTPDAYASGGPPVGGPADSSSQVRSQGSMGSGIAASGEESLAKATAARTVNAGRPPVGPADQMPVERATPARPPAAPEPLPQRRRRVLSDLRRVRSRRQRVAIVTANVGEILGLGLEPDGALRTRPLKGDYARIGRMMREYGDERTWITACQIAGHAIEGNPLDYLQACLENDTRLKPRRIQSGEQRTSPRRSRRARIVTPGEMPEPQYEEPLPPPQP